MSFEPADAFLLDRERCATNLRSAPRGSAPGLAGDTYKHLKILLDDETTTLLHLVAVHPAWRET
eukprot:7457467-Alexandrium_andersonii.AAC.1